MERGYFVGWPDSLWIPDCRLGLPDPRGIRVWDSFPAGIPDSRGSQTPDWDSLIPDLDQ